MKKRSYKRGDLSWGGQFSSTVEFRCTEMVKYSGTCLIQHTKGPGKCVGLYMMSEFSCFILVNRYTLWPKIFVGCHRRSENSRVGLHKFHCTTKLSPSREVTPFIWPLFHCRRVGLIRYLLTKIKHENSDIMYNPTHLPGPLVCWIRQVPLYLTISVHLKSDIRGLALQKGDYSIMYFSMSVLVS
jgi:hypothetical protein